MCSKLLILVSILYLVYQVQGNDLRKYLNTHQDQSKKILDKIYEADPALWKRKDEITIEAPFNHIVSAVYVTDLRENKDGEATVVRGGVGQGSIVIGLKSPSILRGYKFQIVAFAESLTESIARGISEDLSYYPAKGGYNRRDYDDLQYGTKH